MKPLQTTCSKERDLMNIKGHQLRKIHKYFTQDDSGHARERGAE